MQTDGKAGGSGQELWVSNIDLSFDFDIPLQGLSLQYGEYGGTNILQINNVTQSTADFASLHGMDFNGAVVSVISGGDMGAIFVTGPINSFGISRQELAIDNVIACVPEPATLAFLGLGGMLLLKRKK